MSNPALTELMERVRELDWEERVELFEMVGGSLDESQDPEYEAAWAAEIKRRIDAFDSGATKAEPVEALFKKLDQIQSDYLNDQDR